MPGARELITVEYNLIEADKRGLRTMTPREMAQAWLAGEFAEARHLWHHLSPAHGTAHHSTYLCAASWLPASRSRTEARL